MVTVIAIVTGWELRLWLLTFTIIVIVISDDNNYADPNKLCYVDRVNLTLTLTHDMLTLIIISYDMFVLTLAVPCDVTCCDRPVRFSESS